MNEIDFVNALVLDNLDTSTFIDSDVEYYEFANQPYGQILIVKDCYLVDQRLCLYKGDMVAWDWVGSVLDLEVVSRANNEQ